MIRVLIADDHDLVRTGLSRMLSDVEGLVIVGEASSGEEAVEKCRSLKPQVVLMDVRMPGIGGLEATRKISRSFPEIQVIAVTVCNDELYPAKLMEAGAAGYVTKGISIDEMVTTIRAVVLGKRYISPDIAQQMALKSLHPSSGSPFEKLSSREMQICLMIVSCEKVQAISDKLCLSTKTVNSYRYRIFEKLQINSDVELTHLAIRYRLIEVGQDAASV